nr:cellulose binding domain-containing protein [Micromonospora sp. DSM 115978]
MTSISRVRRGLVLGLASLLVAAGAVAARSDTAGAAACSPLPGSLPAAGSLPAVSELPDPFRFWDGTRMTSSDEWACRRDQLRELLQYYEYGHLPPAPTNVTGTRNGNTLTVTVQANGRTASFNASLSLPAGAGPHPAIIMLNPLAASVTSRGYGEVTINPNSIAADSTSKTGAFWTLYPNSDAGVLMAWAWGVHRTLDALRAIPQIDTSKVGVSGYSRYGKAATVAGAFDDRIALTVPGSAGTAGMGNYRFFSSTGSNNETLDDILGAAYWFTPRFATFRGQATRLPIDQHELGALIAPRLLLITNGTEGSDIRTNPIGTSYSYRAARMVYEYLGVPDRIGVAYRPGGHQIDINDYNAIMDFADKYLRGLNVSRTFNTVPYPPSSAAIPWTIPTGGGPTTPPTTPPTTTPPTGPPPTTPPTSAPPTTPPPAGACSAAYRTVNSWPGGYQGDVTVRAGTSPINGWTVRWSAVPAITQVWGGILSGGSVRNASWNGSLAPNATTTFGFIANGSPATPALTCTSP